MVRRQSKQRLSQARCCPGPAVLLVFLFLNGIAGAQSVPFEDQETRHLLRQAGANYRAIGETLGNRRLIELADSISRAAEGARSSELRRGRSHADFRRAFRRQVDLAGQLAEKLPDLGDLSRATNSENSDWPTASCDITDPPNAGDPGPDGWVAVLTAISALAAAAEAEIQAAESCYKIEAAEIVSDPAIIAGECIDEAEAATATVEVTDPGNNDWLGAANVPAICTPYDNATVAATLVVTNLKLVLGCWSSGKITATLGRLPTLKESLEPLIAQAELMRRIFIELNLHKRSGSPLATLYLPEEHGGQLESVQEYTEEAITETAASGYEIDPKTNGFLTEANEAFAAGDFKHAFERFRRAYRQATAHSIRHTQ